jgi:nucleotide-binding universal stress UspA family protein
MEIHAVLVATDFSECSCAAFQAAKSLSRPFNAKIILLHVINERRVWFLTEHLQMEEDKLIPELRARAEEQLQAFIEKCSPDNLEIESMVSVGTPFQQIAVTARDLAVDLVVLGGYGKGGRAALEEVFFGSTAEKVVRLLPCPVLCVPLAREGQEQA